MGTAGQCSQYFITADERSSTAVPHLGTGQGIDAAATSSAAT
jgi:hypothetical protein